jgi:hypothetical protein
MTTPTPAGRGVTGEEMWELLPAALRVRDAEAGGLLRAVVEAMATEAATLSADIDALSDDWFIETCAEWLVPYIGDLLGVRGLHPLSGTSTLSNRAWVAGTIGFRRRKGTVAMLEELARTTTGWTAKAVEYFELLSTTQNLNAVRLHAPATADVRDAGRMELVDTPFDSVSHTVCVRPLGTFRSGHNLPNVGLFVWPVASYPVQRATGVAASEPPDGRWFVDPLGVDHHLAGPTVTELSVDQRAGESNTPGLLRRLPLHEELDAQRAAPVDPARLSWFAPDDPALVAWIQPTAGDELAAVPLELLHVCNLSNWGLPSGSEVRVDPVLGRVTVASGRPIHRLAISWSLAAGADIGALPSPRRGDLGAAEGEPRWQIAVSVSDPPIAGEVVPTLGDAIAAWHDWQAANPATSGRIVIMDNHRYPEPLVAGGGVRIGPGARLAIVAARWPAPPGGGPRRPAAIDPDGARPAIVGDVEVAGTGAGDRPGGFVLDGVLLAGRLRIVAPSAGDEGIGPVEVRRCTLVPAAGGIAVDAGNSRCELLLHRSLCGPVVVDGETAALRCEDSVVHDPADGTALDAAGCDVVLAGVTMLGATSARRLSADDTIFTATATVARRQQGCIRFSYVPPGSATGRRYRCQPDLALAEAAKPGAPPVPPAATIARLVPAHESRDLASPGYARLAAFAAQELRTGAESGAEMGAYRSALSPQRLANLRGALDEYLPFGRVAEPLLVRERGDQR